MQRHRRASAAAVVGLALVLAGCTGGRSGVPPTGAAPSRASLAPSAESTDLSSSETPTPPATSSPATASPTPSGPSAAAGAASGGHTGVPAPAPGGQPAPASPAAPPARAAGAPPSGFDKVVGTGTAASCTYDALAAAVRTGGSIGFWCGPDPVTITVASTLYTCNRTTCRNDGGGQVIPSMTLDGGGLVTLSGAGARGIYYAAACSDVDKLGWVAGRCDFSTNTYPRVTFRNITFANGNSQGYPAGFTGQDVGVPAGGGAILMIGGTLSVQGVTFRDNVCMTADSDAGGGAIRVFGMPTPVTISASRFANNRCANGGAVSSLQAPLAISGSTFTGNVATGHDNSAGLGGNGGAVYFDGTAQDVVVRSSTMTGNTTGVNAGGSAIFYVSNDSTGALTIDASTLTGNSGQAFFTAPYTSLFFQGRALTVTGGTVQ